MGKVTIENYLLYLTIKGRQHNLSFQMKIKPGGSKTLYVGGVYKVTGSTVTKYHFAGNQRVARKALCKFPVWLPCERGGIGCKISVATYFIRVGGTHAEHRS